MVVLNLKRSYMIIKHDIQLPPISVHNFSEHVEMRVVSMTDSI